MAVKPKLALKLKPKYIRLAKCTMCAHTELFCTWFAPPIDFRNLSGLHSTKPHYHVKVPDHGGGHYSSVIFLRTLCWRSRPRPLFFVLEVLLWWLMWH